MKHYLILLIVLITACTQEEAEPEKIIIINEGSWAVSQGAVTFDWDQLGLSNLQWSAGDGYSKLSEDWSLSGDMLEITTKRLHEDGEYIRTLKYTAATFNAEDADVHTGTLYYSTESVDGSLLTENSLNTLFVRL